MSRRGLLVLIASAASWAGASAAVDQLDGVKLDVIEVADSGAYFVYSYAVTNPTTSTWGLGLITVDISASSGTPPNLPHTGALLDATQFSTNSAPRAEVGPISPAGWTAGIETEARLTWYPGANGFASYDSVSPGGTKGGFGIRSSYLPGVAEVEARPTRQSCCTQPAPGTDTTDAFFYPSPSSFTVTGQGIVPRYFPSEVSLALLEAQAAAVCTDPLWIDDTPLCGQVADSLNATESRLASGNSAGARAALEGVLAILDAERQPAGPIEDNAYWLLKMNTAHVLSTIPGGALTLASTGDTYLRQGNPNQNQGDEAVLSIRASGRHRALIQVDAGQLTSVTGPVTSARLEFEIVLNAENWGTSGRTIDAHRMLVPWTETGATWNCPDDTDPEDSTPDCDGAEWEMTSLNPSPYASAPSGTLLVTGDLEGTVSVDVTADVQAMVAGQMESYGWIVRKTAEGAAGRIEIASRESGTGPRLVIE